MKKIVISGSTSGIGKAISEALLAAGYAVIGVARNHQKLSWPQNYFPYIIDFSKITYLEKELKKIRSQHEIDGIICCAGYGDFKSIEQFSVQNIIDIMNVNFLSQSILIKTFLPLLKKRGLGNIIVIGSEAALKGDKNGSFYCASKFALRGFTQALRRECQQSRIAVTMINPGAVNTSFFQNLDFIHGADESNFIDKEQIAKLILNLLDMDNNCVCEEINLQPMKRVFVKK